MDQYQQGDVVIQQISQLPDGVRQKEVDDAVVLAEGEVTGHAHRIFDEGVKLFRFDDFASTGVSYISVPAGGATIQHEEHDAYQLPEGIYQTSIVREEDHLDGTTRFVLD